MSDGFTTEDRKMLIKTHTTVNIISELHTKTLDDHEERLRKGESFRARVIGWAAGAGILTVASAEALKIKLGL